MEYGKANNNKSRDNSVNSGNSASTTNTAVATKQGNMTTATDNKATKQETRYEGSINEKGEYEIERVKTNEKEVVVPKMIDGAPVCRILYSAFKGKKDIVKIVLPDTVTYIGSYAFSFCESLETVEISKGLKSIGDMAFAGCTKLKTVNIPEETTKVGAICNFNPILTDVYIPASVTEITGPILDQTCPNAIIVTPKGSVAEKHAIENKFNFRNN